MGEAELLKSSGLLIIHSVFYFYGDDASQELSIQIAEDIASHWNQPKGKVAIRGVWYLVQFDIEGYYEPDLSPETVWYNTNPRFNYFRVESFSQHHVSFVDGLPSNTGYFKTDNLFNNSTTAAHEYGHTLGLVHPDHLDIRGRGTPGIMYPRGTVCDPEFQYDPNALPLQAGGTMNPYMRKVLQTDLDQLRLSRLSFNADGFAVLGDFSSIYHEKHLPLV